MLDGDSGTVPDALGVPEAVPLSVADGESVVDSVGDMDGVVDAVELADEVGVTEADAVGGKDGVSLGLAPSESNKVGVLVSVAVELVLPVGEADGVGVTLGESDGEELGLGVREADVVAVAVGGSGACGLGEIVCVAVGELEPVPVPDGVADGVADTDAVPDAVPDTVPDGVPLLVRVALRVGLVDTLVVTVPLTVLLRDTERLGLTLALAPTLRLAVGVDDGVRVALGGQSARRTLGAPPSAITTLRLAASHATAIGALSVAPVPTPSAMPTARPPRIVLTAPVAASIARIAALPASATKMNAPSKATPAAVVEKDASAPRPSALPCAPAPASVDTARVARTSRRSRKLPESMM